MVFNVKNKSLQVIVLLLANGNSLNLAKRGSINLEEKLITKQMKNLQGQGILQIVRVN